MKRGDVWIGVILLVIIAAFFIPRFLGSESEGKQGKSYARITVEGKLYKQVELTEELQEIQIETEEGWNLLRIFDGGAQMIEADCDDQICLTFGFIDRRGQSIICLPHKILVEIVGEQGQGGGEIDAVVQ